MLLAAAIALSLNPLGYFGGHWDDGRYLDAALDWHRLGRDHWALRWPVVMPAATAVRSVGLSRFGLMLPGLAMLLAVLAVNFWATRRVLGLRVAVLASLALLTTPEIVRAATRLTADLPELLFWSAALWALWFGRHGARGWLIAAGASAACAWATRETGLGLLLLFALAFVTGAGPPRRAFGWTALGFALVWLPEQLLLWSASGDPLYRVHTDLRHIEIPSDDLAGSTAHGASAPLNTSLMRRWSGAGPLRVHWAIDPWLNLLANPAYGLDFLLAALGLAGLRKRGLWRGIALLALIAAVNVGVTTYVIATDPKPRMFMPATGAACLALAMVASALWRHRAVLRVAAAAKVIVAFVLLDVATSYAELPALVATALARTAGPVHVDRWTASSLAIAPQPRLTTLPAQRGDLYLTAGKLGDYTGTDRPPPGRWQPLWRGHGARLPLTIRAAQTLGLARDYRYPALYVTLYRRL